MDTDNKQFSSIFISKRLEATLKNIPAYPLTILEAPMGYGKTTAVKAALQNTDATVLWQNIYDKYSDVFWYDFCSLIQQIDPEAGHTLRVIGFPDDNISRQEALQTFRAIKFTQNTFIVLDDYHLAANEWLDEFISILAKSQLPKLHIILTTRLFLMENINELKLKNILLHISQNDLELSSNDIKEYCKAAGLNITSEIATQLHAISEGWISALYLILLSLSANGSKPAASDLTDLQMTDIYGLMEKAVYNPLPAESKEFLQTICLFDIFTKDQARHMWNNSNSDALLDDLITRNVFVTYNSRSNTYQIHNILNNYLRNLQTKTDSSIIQNRYNAAARWFLINDDYVHAMHYAYLAKDFSLLLDAFEKDMGRHTGPDKKDILIEYFTECPENILADRPLAVLIYALSLTTFSEEERFMQICSSFPGWIAESTMLDASEKQRYMGEFEVLLSLTKYNDIDEIHIHQQAAWELLGQPVSFFDTHGGWWTFGTPSVLYMFHRKSGQLKQDITKIKTALPLYSKLTSGHGHGGDYVMESEWHYNAGRFDDANICSHSAMAAGLAAIQPEIVISALFLQARLAISQGQFNAALAAFEQMRTEVKQKDTYFLLHTIEMAEAFIFLNINLPDKIPGWIMSGEFHSNRLMFPAIGFANILLGRAMLIQGDYHKLLGLFDQFMEIASIFPNLLSQLYLLIQTGAAQEKLLRYADAEASVIAALELTATDELYMPFVENCDFIKPVLDRLAASDTPYSEAIEQIIFLYQPYKKSIAGILTEICGKPTLSVREMEIASLAAQGLSNAEIADRLFISQNTVKSQLKSVFNKLGISSRALLKQHLENTD